MILRLFLLNYMYYIHIVLVLKTLHSNVFGKAYILCDSVGDFSNVSAKLFFITV